MQRRADLARRDARHRSLIGARYRGGRPVLACLRHNHHAPTDGALLSYCVHRPMVGHREQPGGESASRWVVSGRVTPQGQEDFLDHAFGQLLVGADPAGC